MILFDIPMCMAHRGLWALVQEACPKATVAVFVNRRWTAAKVMRGRQIIVHVRTDVPMSAAELIALSSFGGTLDKAIQKRIRLKAGEMKRRACVKKAA